MKKVFKKTAGLTLTAALLCSGSAFASPVSTSTSGLFTSDKDNAASVTDWSSVTFDRWMIAADLDTRNFDMTGAFKIGNMVIAPSLTGNGLYTYLYSTATETVSHTIVDNHTAGSTVTSSLDPDVNSKADHTLAPGVLIGLGNLGIRFDYGFTNKTTFDFYEPVSGDAGAVNSTTTKYDKDGNVVSQTITEYTRGKNLNITNSPSFSAGLVLTAGDIVYKPYAGLAVSVLTTGMLTQKNVTSIPATSTTTESTRNTINSKITFIPNTGVIISVPGKNERLRFVYTADYTGKFDLNATNYRDAFGTKTHFGSFTGYTKNTVANNLDGSSVTTTEVEGTYTRGTQIYNTLTGGCKVIYDAGDTVHLAARLNLTADINYGSSKEFQVNTTKVVSTDKFGESTTTEKTSTGQSVRKQNFKFAVEPVIDAALVYDIKPGKFSLNVGALIKAPALSYNSLKTTKPDLAKKTIRTTDSSGNVTDNSTTVIYANQTAKRVAGFRSDYFNSSLYTGFSFFVNENIELDAALMLGITGSSIGDIFGGSLKTGCVIRF